MEEDGILLSERDHQRVGRVVVRAEGQLFGLPAAPSNRDGAQTHHVVRVQSGAANTFGYPARVQVWNSTTGAHADYDTTEVRISEPNGATYTEGEYVSARLLGTNSDGVACFTAAIPTADRIEVGEPFNSGVTPPHARLLDWRVVYLDLTDFEFDAGESIWVVNANA